MQCTTSLLYDHLTPCGIHHAVRCAAQLHRFNAVQMFPRGLHYILHYLRVRMEHLGTLSPTAPPTQQQQQQQHQRSNTAAANTAANRGSHSASGHTSGGSSSSSSSTASHMQETAQFFPLYRATFAFLAGLCANNNKRAKDFLREQAASAEQVLQHLEIIIFTILESTHAHSVMRCIVRLCLVKPCA
jgi:hypothetical protein